MEIGALASPLRLDPLIARARYLVCLGTERLRENYPEHGERRFVTPDVLVPRETLEGIPAGSQDFVVASHVLEHMEDPLGALEEWHRVLVPGGLLFLAVPDMRFTADRSRPRTPIEHLVRDHADGGRSSRRDHIREFGRAHLGLETEEEIAGFVKRVDEIDYKVHFHVWVPDDLLEVVRHMQAEMRIEWVLEEWVEVEGEAILLLGKEKGAS